MVLGHADRARAAFNVARANPRSLRIVAFNCALMEAIIRHAEGGPAAEVQQALATAIRLFEGGTLSGLAFASDIAEAYASIDDHANAALWLQIAANSHQDGHLVQVLLSPLVRSPDDFWRGVKTLTENLPWIRVEIPSFRQVAVAQPHAALGALQRAVADLMAASRAD